MAIRTKCDKCGKQISVDDAFAGGVCRCPYCKTLVMVQAVGGPVGTSSRPQAPAGRPDAPQADLADAPVHHDENVPMAKPVRLQGIMTLLLAAIILAMVIGGVVVAMQLRKNGGKTPSTALPAVGDAPFVPPEVPDEEGLKVATPVVYCIDTASSMKEMYDYAVAMTRLSIRALKEDEKFSVMLCVGGTADDDASWQQFLPAQPRGGGPQGENAIKGDLELIDHSGASDIGRSLKAAIATKPKTIVVFARKKVNSALETAKLARDHGIRIITVALNADNEAIKSLALLARITGGQSHVYSYGQLQEWLTGVEMD